MPVKVFLGETPAGVARVMCILGPVKFSRLQKGALLLLLF